MKKYINKFINEYIKSFAEVYTLGKLREKLVYTIGSSYAVMLIPYIITIPTRMNKEIAAVTFIAALIIFSIAGMAVSIKGFRKDR